MSSKERLLQSVQKSCTLPFVYTFIRVWLPQTDWAVGIYCLQFYYNMHGASMGSLLLVRRRGQGKNRVLWQRSGDHGNEWYEANVGILLHTGVQVNFTVIYLSILKHLLTHKFSYTVDHAAYSRADRSRFLSCLTGRVYGYKGRRLWRWHGIGWHQHQPWSMWEQPGRPGPSVWWAASSSSLFYAQAHACIWWHRSTCTRRDF